MSTNRHILSGPFSAGEVLRDRYEVLQFLGSGAMGWVLLVEDRTLDGEKLAIKLMYPHLISDSSSLARFRNEVLVTRKLLHANIVRTYSFGSFSPEHHFFSMEYVEGDTLQRHLKENERFSLQDCLTYLSAIAAGVSVAHRHGIVHRDLKPENVLISTSGELKVADFGISSMLQIANKSGEAALGTPHYMSPEQLRGEPLDPRSDIYSFGIMAYELAAGKRPFAGNSLYALYEQHSNAPLPSLADTFEDIPQWFDKLLSTCTEKERQNRFQSFDEIRAVIAPHVELTETKEVPAAHQIDIPICRNMNANCRWEHVTTEQQKVSEILNFLSLSAIILSVATLFFISLLPSGGQGAMSIVGGILCCLFVQMYIRGKRVWRLLSIAGSVIVLSSYIAIQNPATWKRVTGMVLRAERTSGYKLSFLRFALGITLGVDNVEDLLTTFQDMKPTRLQAMIRSGMNLDVRTADGTPVLHRAAADAHPSTFDLVLKETREVDARDSLGQTALHLAITSRRGGPIIANLLERGADPNARDAQGQTPLYFALQNSHQLATELLLRHGADREMKLFKGREESSLLHESVKLSNPRFLQTILRGYESVDRVDGKGRTALQMAFELDQLNPDRQEIIDLLLQKGASKSALKN